MYGKVFTSMYDGTLATRGPWQALVTFQQMIVLCDSTGVIDMTPESISRRTTIPIEIIKVGIAALEQPDSESRSPDLEGRRITRLSEHRDWGWQLVNYAQYRAMRSAEERREYMRQYQRERRSNGPEPVNTPSTPVNPRMQCNLGSMQYAEEDTKARSRTTPLPPKASRSRAPAVAALPPGVRPEVWEAWVEHRSSGRWKLTASAISLQTKKLAKLGGDPNEIIEQSIANGWTGLFPLRTTTTGARDEQERRRQQVIDQITGADIAGTAERLAD